MKYVCAKIVDNDEVKKVSVKQTENTDDILATFLFSLLLHGTYFQYKSVNKKIVDDGDSTVVEIKLTNENILIYYLQYLLLIPIKNLKFK